MSSIQNSSADKAMQAWVVENSDSNDILMNDVSNSRNTSSLTSSAQAASERSAISNTASNDGLCRTPSASGPTNTTDGPGYILSGSGDLASEGVYDWPRLSVASQAHLLKRRGMKKAGRRMNLVALNLMKADNKKMLDFKSGRAGPGLRRTGSYNRL